MITTHCGTPGAELAARDAQRAIASHSGRGTELMA